ncbi:MAG TPA: GGDEF domain-containing protein [Terriglobia bacterium]|nr:GGDEF domain-containing protein [Terriglobia bacterium]
MPRTRIILSAAGLIWLAHLGVIVVLRGQAPGPALSDGIQLILGGMVIYSMAQASQRSEGLAISFWRLGAVAYTLLFVAQSLSVYNDLSHTSIVSWTNNMLFSFWFVPLAMAIFLDPEHEAGKIDTLVALDFVQGVLVCVAAYLYFFFIPKTEASGELSHEVWAPYFVGYSFVAAAFILRAIITRSRDTRVLFGRMGAFLFLSGAIDALYYYGPGRGLKTGAWFDLLWSALLVLPMIIANIWRQTEAPEIALEPQRRDKRIYTEIFFLMYPLLVLFMSLRIARERLGLAGLVVFLSFVCSSARLLVTQHRLLQAREALRREASRDGLTSLWNRKAILSILERELLRGQRDRQSVGLIMIDVDHFKTINDTRGHAAGDAVLRIIASGIAAMVRPYDSVGRIGGEEFLIVAPNCALGETWELAERVRVHVANCSIMAGGSAVRVSLSLGVATASAANDLEKLLHAADSALYQAKNAGRNRVEPNQGRAAGAGQSASSAPNRDFWI